MTMTARKTPATGNPDEAASVATAKATKAPVGDPYTQLALEWTLRRLYEGAARPFARRNVERDRTIDENVRQVLLDRLDLMGF
jgi:hypothetical protein